jgi:hypothetical protein
MIQNANSLLAGLLSGQMANRICLPHSIGQILVGIDESDPSEAWVSWTSPVVKALLGKCVGDTKSVKLPMGIRL